MSETSPRAPAPAPPPGRAPTSRAAPSRPTSRAASPSRPRASCCPPACRSCAATSTRRWRRPSPGSASPRASTTIRFAGQGPVLLATRIEDAKLPTVLGYGHGDVIRGLEDQWTKGKGPWVTARDGDRLYGRGTADNKGQHTINMAALEAVRAGARRQARLQRQVHHRDGRGGGLQGPGRAGRRPQGGLRRRRAGRLRRPAREAGAPDHDAGLPRRHQLRPRRATCARAGITPATGAG